jgi:hypothetical protein
LAEGGQIVSGMTTFDRAMKGDVGSLVVKPIKDDVSLYKLPKTGFTIDWSVNDDGTFIFISNIGKRSVGSEVVVTITLDNYNRNVLKSNFLSVVMLRGNYGFTFVSEPQTPIYAVTKFINFLRFNGNQKAFLENYDPNTLSVYNQGGGLGQQGVSLNPAKIIADAVADDLLRVLTKTMGEEAKNKIKEFAYNYITLRSNLTLKASENVAAAFVNFKTQNPNPNNWYGQIYDLCFYAKDFIVKTSLLYETEEAFANASDSPMKTFVINEIIPKLIKQREIARNLFANTYADKDDNVWTSIFNSKTINYLNDEILTIKAIYFLYLIK